MAERKATATIGMFDGVHSGHNFLLQQLEEEAAGRHSRPLVITFPDHPLKIIAPDREPPRLTPPNEKHSLLSVRGKFEVVALEFNESLRKLSARDFLTMIRDRFGVGTLVMGYDHHFGHDRIKDRSEYTRIGDALGVEIVFAEPLVLDGQPICSSLIRRLISEGNIKKANEALGRPYSLKAKVVEGKHIGRTIGFPTANLKPMDGSQLLPATGVYAVLATLSDGTEYRGMLNIGVRPTVDRSSNPVTTVEVNLFDCDRDLYGSELTVAFIDRLRGERKFDTLEELRHQLDSDRRQSLSILERTT